MSRLTLRLPKSLHQQLTYLATKEEISLNQYIVYALTRQVSSSYLVQEIPEDEIKQQKQEFKMLLDDLGEASDEEIKTFLNNREKVQPEPELTEKILGKFQDLINN